MAKQAKKGAAPAKGLPKRIIVHAPSALTALDRKALLEDIASAAPLLPEVEIAPDLAGAENGRMLLANLAGARVRDLKVPNEFHTATTTDLEFEAAVDREGSSISSAQLAGLVYDGNLAAHAALNVIPEDSRSLDTLHLWVTRRLMGTYAPDDMRYHARFTVFGYPAVFSVLGLGLAPAPSLEATLFARELHKRGANPGQIEAETDRQYPEERLDIDDPQTLTAAVASAVLQGAAALAGQGPFCDDKNCRLYNAHRKRELRDSMLAGRLCASHAKLFGSGGRSK